MAKNNSSRVVKRVLVHHDELNKADLARLFTEYLDLNGQVTRAQPNDKADRIKSLRKKVEEIIDLIGDEKMREIAGELHRELEKAAA